MPSHFNPSRALALTAALALAIPTLAAPTANHRRTTARAELVGRNDGKWVDDSHLGKWNDDADLGKWRSTGGSQSGANTGSTPVIADSDEVDNDGEVVAPVVTPSPVPVPAPAPVPVTEPDIEDGTTAVPTPVDDVEEGTEGTMIGDGAEEVTTTAPVDAGESGTGRSQGSSTTPPLPVGTGSSLGTGTGAGTSTGTSASPGGLQIVENCSVEGQVALTYDGKSPVHLIPYRPICKHE